MNKQDLIIKTTLLTNSVLQNQREIAEGKTPDVTVTELERQFVDSLEAEMKGHENGENEKALEETYTVKARCTNCGHKWTGKKPKGEKFNHIYEACPNCKCFTVTGVRHE